MSIPRLRAALLLLLLMLGGCASAPYGIHYADEYGGAEYYYDSYTPTYIAYPAYYNALWPVYNQWYDPFFAPGFYYGITFFPSYYNHWGWGGWGGRLAWSPWRSAWWDSHHDWYYWSLRSPTWYAQRQHLGSAQNRQVARAALSGQPRRGTADLQRSRHGTAGAPVRTGAARSALPSSSYSPRSRGHVGPARGSRTISRPAPAAGAQRRSDAPMRAAPAPVPRPAQPRPARSRPAPARAAPPPVSRPARTNTAPARASRNAPTRSRHGR